MADSLVVRVTSETKNAIEAELSGGQVLHFVAHNDEWRVDIAEFLTVIQSKTFSDPVEAAVDACAVTWDYEQEALTATLEVMPDGSTRFVGMGVDVGDLPSGLYLCVSGARKVDTTAGIFERTIGEIKQTDLTMVTGVTAHMAAILNSFRVFAFAQVAQLPYTTWVGIGGNPAGYDAAIQSALALHEQSVR